MMNKAFYLTPLLAGMILTGCDSVGPVQSTPLKQDTEYPSAPPTSLFPSDQAVLGDDAVARILSSKVQLPTKSKMALMKFQEAAGWGWRYYGGYRWRDEDYQKLQQSQLQTLTDPMMASGQIIEVTPMPSLLTPKQPTIPILREAALRMQADLLLVYRIGSDTYSQYRVFTKDRVKAYSTCELVLLDVRTGLIPFTRVISRDQLEPKRNDDADLGETTRRAEQKSATAALQAAASDLTNFLNSVSKRAD